MGERIDTSDPGKAALVAFAAAWLFCRTSEMNAENSQRSAFGGVMAYNDVAFASAQQESIVLATSGELPAWVKP